ncbi:hypothetical protein [Kribbella sp. NPDC051770]|uniref:hypothetical protein n=1 Tax=Kribbella sp. NPDC051770 TaxID=3155413 RepID=UPI003443CB49
MTEPGEALERFLATDPRDAGCAATSAVLHLYAELPAADAAERYPGVAAHLAGCAACAENAEGLLAALRNDPA